MTYSYADLKGRTDLIGRKVRFFNGDKGTIKKIDSEGFLVDNWYCFFAGVGTLTIIEEPVTWENLGTDPSREDFVLYGDVKRKVLGRLNNIVFLSQISKLDCIGNFLTIIELKEKNYTIVQPEPETPKPTREEILAKLTQEERDIIEGK